MDFYLYRLWFRWWKETGAFFCYMNLLKDFFLSHCIFSGARGKWGGRKQKLWRTSLLTFHEVSWLLFETNLWLILFQFNFESLFRSLHYALMDNCCREYLFLVDFYMASGTASQDLFNAIMSKTLQTYLVCNCKSCDWCLTFLVFFVFLQSFLFTVCFFFHHVENNGGTCIRVLRLYCHFPVHSHCAQI